MCARNRCDDTSSRHKTICRCEFPVQNAGGGGDVMCVFDSECVVHTNCTKPAIVQMIKLMQEQGEIVCVVGGASSSTSCECYAAADVSIALRAHRLECADDSQVMHRVYEIVC
jgi:hypothetical protein